MKTEQDTCTCDIELSHNPNGCSELGGVKSVMEITNPYKWEFDNKGISGQQSRRERRKQQRKK